MKNYLLNNGKKIPSSTFRIFLKEKRFKGKLFSAKNFDKLLTNKKYNRCSCNL